MRAIRKIALVILQVVAGIACVVFFLMPLSTSTQVLACIAALAVGVFCYLLSTALEQGDTDYSLTKRDD